MAVKGSAVDTHLNVTRVGGASEVREQVVLVLPETVQKIFLHSGEILSITCRVIGEYLAKCVNCADNLQPLQLTNNQAH